MDFIKIKKRISASLGKYKYACIVLVVGMLLMAFPDVKTDPVPAETEPVDAGELSVQEELESILCQIEGAGAVKVMLSVEQGERTIYQTNSDYSQGENSSDSHTETVLITDSQRNEAGLIHQKNPPVYLGAIVLAKGADSPSVKLAIVDAVCDVTGLGADRISVLKMK